TEVRVPNLVLRPLTVETRFSRATRPAPTGTLTTRSAICWTWVTRRRASAVVALEALSAVDRAVLAVRRALPLVAELVRLAVVLALLAVRWALARVAEPERRVSLRFRVAAA